MSRGKVNALAHADLVIVIIIRRKSLCRSIADWWTDSQTSVYVLEEEKDVWQTQTWTKFIWYVS